MIARLRTFALLALALGATATIAAGCGSSGRSHSASTAALSGGQPAGGAASGGASPVALSATAIYKPGPFEACINKRAGGVHATRLSAGSPTGGGFAPLAMASNFWGNGEVDVVATSGDIAHFYFTKDAAAVKKAAGSAPGGVVPMTQRSFTNDTGNPPPSPQAGNAVAETYVSPANVSLAQRLYPIIQECLVSSR